MSYAFVEFLTTIAGDLCWKQNGTSWDILRQYAPDLTSQAVSLLKTELIET